MDNYHYPLGADTEEAPWNQKDIPEKEFDVTCTICISKTVPCFTNDYIPGAEYIKTTLLTLIGVMFSTIIIEPFLNSWRSLRSTFRKT